MPCGQSVELSNQTLTLENQQPIHPIQEVGTQEDLMFYRDQTNQLFQRFANSPHFLKVVHERTDIFVDSLYDYVIKYDLSAQCGFSVWDENEETCFFEGLWSLREVEEEIYDSLVRSWTVSSLAKRVMNSFVPLAKQSLVPTYLRLNSIVPNLLNHS